MTIFIAELAMFNYVMGICIYYIKRWSKILCAIVVIGDAGALLYYKYANFFISNIHTINFFSNIALLSYVVIPLGISFFTFELIHYIVDIYKGKKPVFHIVNFFVFVFFFPTLIAGPIKRFEQFVPQLKNHVINYPLIQDGILLIIRGLFKKIVIADTLSNFVQYGFGGTENSLVMLIGVYAFSFQIFFDFSGYTDLGRGSAALLGIYIPENFIQPYLSRNIREFWRRWHITLMAWLRDYIYIPLGGSRKKRIRNTLVVFLLSGLWHGAAWHFVFWGLYNGILMILQTVVKPYHRFFTTLGDSHKWISIFLTFQLVTIGWIFFRSPDLSFAFDLIKNIFIFTNYHALDHFTAVRLFLITSILLIYGLVPVVVRAIRMNSFTLATVKYVLYGFALCCVFAYAPPFTIPFIYFQF